MLFQPIPAHALCPLQDLFSTRGPALSGLASRGGRAGRTSAGSAACSLKFLGTSCIVVSAVSAPCVLCVFLNVVRPLRSIKIAKRFVVQERCGACHSNVELPVDRRIALRVCIRFPLFSSGPALGTASAHRRVRASPGSCCGTGSTWPSCSFRGLPGSSGNHRSGPGCLQCRRDGGLLPVPSRRCLSPASPQHLCSAGSGTS